MKDQLYSRYLTYFFLFQIVFVQIISRYPKTIEFYYSNGIYIQIAAFFRRSLGWIPFSVGDLLYGFFGLLFIRFIYIMIRDKFSELRRYFFAAGATLSVLYFLFYANWGLNYYRVPLKDRLGIKSSTYTQNDLEMYADKLLVKLNRIHLEITNDENEKVVVPYKRKEIYKTAKKGYEQLSQKHPFLKYKFNSIKSSLLSTPLTYMGFSGYLNPFTGEAQVNSKMPMTNFAFTVCHEMAHQLGYAAENEANFISYLATTSHSDIYFQYAGYLTAYRHILRELYKIDAELFENYQKRMNKGILINIQESQDFWSSYENPMEPVIKKSYSTYLKANKQKGGIQSYSYMVNLLLNYE